MSTPSDYSATSLSHVKGLEAVRRRPGMYIGGTGTRALTHCSFEVIDNSVDEALAGFCTDISVVLFADGSVQVSDNGRGIPVDIEPESGQPGVILVLTELHAGGKLDDNGSYKTSGGLNGVGASVVNALSSRMDVEVDRDGQTHTISFQQGEPGHFDGRGGFTASQELKVGKGPANSTGTRVRFFPDRDIFDDDAVLDVAAITDRLRQTAFLVPGLTITLSDETGEAPVTHTFRFDGGTKDFVEYRATDRPLSETLQVTGQAAFANRRKRDGETTEEDKPVEVDIALRWGIGYEPSIASFVNIVQTPQGGTHVAGLERALVKVVGEQLRTQRVAKAKDAPVIKDDILEGLTAVVTVRLSEPKFLGQTKDALDERPVTAIVADLVTAALTGYFTGKNKAEARKVLEKIQEAARTRVAARETKEAKRRKTALESSSMPAKLVDCRSEDTELAELFIVEGDSALGTFKGGRDSEFQAALPIRGKILNVERATEKKMLANSECAAIIQVMGAGSGRSFNLDNLRYGKLLVLADADVDGSHIRCLLLTLCWQYMRPLLEAGRVYATVPPLHRIEVSGTKEYIYTYSDAEMKSEVAKLEKAGKKVKGMQRYKGLGEMDADQLWETTLDPKRRRLRRMTLTDAEAASRSFDEMMGDNPAPRREMLFREGHLVSNLDV